MLIGQVMFWDKRGFGFAETRSPMASGGYQLSRFYLNRTYFDFCYCLPEEISVGNFVKFDVSSRPVLPGKLPTCTNVEVYPNEAAARSAEVRK